jgi:non-canonical purine NTP pyrophosphatase (RdgB/HAM1 family)
MVLYFITGNKNKFEEAKKELAPIQIEQKKIDLDEIQSLDSKEVIEHKLKEALKHNTGEFFVEDASISLNALNGFPGPFAKWFIKSIGRKGIFNLCKSLMNFDAQMKAIIGYTNGKEILFFEGVVKGKIVEEKVQSDFDWDPIFQPEGFTKTFAEMTKEEKNKISHRGKAVKLFKEYYLKKNL